MSWISPQRKESYEDRESLKRFRRYFKLLSPNNISLTGDIISSILIILYRIQKSRTHKSLKNKDIIRAIKLAAHHHLKGFNFKANKLNTKLLGPHITENEALDYYEKNIEGTMTDRLGREIYFNIDDGLLHIYKDEKNDHIKIPQNFKSVRAKRLPWIKYVLENSCEIYKNLDYETYLYVGRARIPLKGKPDEHNYFLIVVDRRQKQNKFITAYSPRNKARLFSILSECVPINIEEFENANSPPVCQPPLTDKPSTHNSSA